jgi:release factor glutamine methyltransferase
MNIAEYLTHTTKKLQAAGIDSARLDCLILLEDVLKQNRASLLAHPELQLTQTQLSVLDHAVARRAIAEPLAYIRGKAAFYGREFAVTPDVLVPRPETEIMVEMLLAIRSSLPAQPRIADVGTGSGCLGVTAALELPTSEVFVLDIDVRALQLATKNAQSLTAIVQPRHANLLHGVHEQFDVLLANLPYVPDAYPVNAAARHEPALALFAGHDGLSLYVDFWTQISTAAQQPRHVFTESLPFQHASLVQLADTANYDLVQSQGLIQHFSLRSHS